MWDMYFASSMLTPFLPRLPLSGFVKQQLKKKYWKVFFLGVCVSESEKYSQKKLMGK